LRRGYFLPAQRAKCFRGIDGCVSEQETVL